MLELRRRVFFSVGCRLLQSKFSGVNFLHSTFFFPFQ